MQVDADGDAANDHNAVDNAAAAQHVTAAVAATAEDGDTEAAEGILEALASDDDEPTAAASAPAPAAAAAENEQAEMDDGSGVAGEGGAQPAQHPQDDAMEEEPRDAEAQYQLGFAYYHGFGIEEEDKLRSSGGARRPTRTTPRRSTSSATRTMTAAASRRTTSRRSSGGARRPARATPRRSTSSAAC